MAMLQLGSSGPDVIDLQDKLRAHGFDPGPSDGSFGPGTVTALEAFQRGTGLTADGVAGPQTVAALGLAVPAAVVGGATADCAGGRDGCWESALRIYPHNGYTPVVNPLPGAAMGAEKRQAPLSSILGDFPDPSPRTPLRNLKLTVFGSTESIQSILR